MVEFFRKLFTSDFMPHGHCYLWTPSVLWTHVTSDLVTAISYYTIPLALVYFVRKRSDLAFNWIFLMFAGFIFACGTTHLMDVWTTWHGTYRLEGVVKAVTGLISAATAVALWRLMPKALSMPTVAQIKKETAEKVLAQQQLSRTQEDLIYETKLREALEKSLQEQEVLKNELDHRVKNTLAIVLSLADQTASRAKSVSYFTESFSGRLKALASSHQLLNRESWGEVRLQEVANKSLEPYLHAENKYSVRVDGPSILLSAKEAQALHMIFHELATNAAKYGALTENRGKLSVEWNLEFEEMHQNLSLIWDETVERDTPSPSSSPGFGTTLIRHLVEFDLKGSIDSTNAPRHIRYSICFQLKRNQMLNLIKTESDEAGKTSPGC